MTAARPAVADAPVRQWRHDLHRSPGTAFDEHATAAHVADVLAVGVAFHVRVVHDVLAG